MKKTIYCLSLLVLSSGLAKAQKNEKVKKEPNVSCEKTYLGLQTGINNHNGLIGVSLEQALAAQWTIGAGVGFGSWGTKVFAEGRYFFHDACYKRTALGLGVTHASGFDGVELKKVNTNYGDRDVKLDGNAATNVALSFYRFWGLGKRQSNRFYITVGYSVRVSKLDYALNRETLVTYPGIALTSNSDKAVRGIAPGGVILGLGFYFGL